MKTDRKVVCICGSTRFNDELIAAHRRETLKGHITLLPSLTRIDDDAEKAAELNELHNSKVELADELLVIVVNGHIGESTRSEIDYAHLLSKPIRYHHV